MNLGKLTIGGKERVSDPVILMGEMVSERRAKLAALRVIKLPVEVQTLESVK
jgi:hypothetical protein